MKKKCLKASSLRNIMMFLIIALLITSICGFYYGQIDLRSRSEVIYRNNKTPTVIIESPQDIKKLQQSVDNIQPFLSKIENFTVPENDSQGQITKDLNVYASKNGISIEDYKFSQTASPGSSQSNSVTITITNPVPYDNLIKFIKSIDNSLPKMQLTGIKLNHPDSSANVTVDPLIIEIFTRI